MGSSAQVVNLTTDRNLEILFEHLSADPYQ